MDPDRPSFVRNWTYFYDFIRIFKAKNSRADWTHVLTEVSAARRSAPSFPELEPLHEGLFRFQIECADDQVVVVDFELDTNGVLQPIMGGSNQD